MGRPVTILNSEGTTRTISSKFVDGKEKTVLFEDQQYWANTKENRSDWLSILYGTIIGRLRQGVRKDRSRGAFKEVVWLKHCFSFISALFLKISSNQEMAELVWSPWFDNFWRSFGWFFECFKCREIREEGTYKNFGKLKILYWGSVLKNFKNLKWIFSRQIQDSPPPQQGASDPISGLIGC